MGKLIGKFDWNRARAFLVTAEQGSLSAAARELGMAQPTLGRQVNALEEELGVVLFERFGRGLRPTPAGYELLDHVRAMGEAANALALTSAGQSQSLEGSVCISATDQFACLTLPKILKKLHTVEPSIRIEVIATNDRLDLRRREADIVLRNADPTDPDLIARKIRTAKGRLYATQKYLDKIGNPKTYSDLNDADFIQIDAREGWMTLLNSLGMALTKRNFPFYSENHMVMWEMMKQGLAIGIADERLGDGEPALQRVLPDMDGLPFPIWLVVHREVNTNRRIRVVYDFLAKELA